MIMKDISAQLKLKPSFYFVKRYRIRKAGTNPETRLTILKASGSESNLPPQTAPLIGNPNAHKN
jgi:hypothetical protein